MNGSNQPIIPTRVEADLIVRHFVDEFVKEYGTGYPLPLDAFAATLSSHVGRILPATHVEEVVELMDAVARVADFDHEDVKVNKALTVNNQPEVLDYHTGQLNIGINNLLDHAGFRGGWVNGTGRTIRTAIAPTTNHLKAAA